MLVRFPFFGYYLVKGVFTVGALHEDLDGEEHCSDSLSRCPIFLQDAQADAPELVEIWVVNPRLKKDLGRLHWVSLREVHL